MSLERDIVEGPHGFGAWFEAYGRIQLKAPRFNPLTNQNDFLVPPVANFLQRQFCMLVQHCLAHRLPVRIILLKPRQKGCSTVSVGFLYWFVRRMGLQGMIIGGEYVQTDELWKILTRYHTYDDYPWEYPGTVKLDRARFEGGGEIGKRTARNQNAGRGGTYQVVIVTELGRWGEGMKSSPGDVLQGVQSTVHDVANTAIILESTAMGNSGVFYEQWQNSVSLEDYMEGNYSGIPFVRLFAPAYAFEDSRLHLTPVEQDALASSLTDDERWRLAEFAPERPLNYIEWRRHVLKNICRNNLTRLKFDYPDTPEEAFHASSQTVFSDVALGKMREVARGFTGDYGVMRRVTDDDNLVWDFEHREPLHSEVVVWERPQIGLSYLVAVDPMTGVANDDQGRNRDHHAVLVIRAGYHDVNRSQWVPAKIVARSRPPTKDPEWNCQWNLAKLEDIIFALHRYYGGCMTVVEANRDGGLNWRLHERGCVLYSRDKTTDRAGEIIDPTSTEKLGFLTVGGRHEDARSSILDELEDAIARYGEPGDGVDIPDMRTLDECAVFVWTKAGRKEAAPGEHDDSVMALAIGYHLRKRASKYAAPKGERPLPPELARLHNRQAVRKAMYS